jgi:hypothetical protein
MHEEPPDNDLDSDFDDGSDGKRKQPSKPSSTKVTVSTNGTCFDTPTWMNKNQGSKGCSNGSNGKKQSVS